MLQACLLRNEDVCQAARWREIDCGVATHWLLKERRGDGTRRQAMKGARNGWEYESEEKERTKERTNERV